MPLENEGGGDTKISIAKANRKIAKPIMEKKRRARINASLNELKALLVEVLQKEGCRHSSKMEKADILEMAVRHLKNLQHQQPYSGGTAMHTLRDSYPPAIPIEKYASSLPTECHLQQEMNHYLNQAHVGSGHLHPASPNSGSVDTPEKLDSNRNILPAPEPIKLNTLATAGTNRSQIAQPVMTRTSNGELAVLLPKHLLKQAANTNGGELILPVYTMPPTDNIRSPAASLNGGRQQPVTISISMPLQQSLNSAFSQTRSLSSSSSSASSASSSSSAASPPPSNGHLQAPASPVWRPW